MDDASEHPEADAPRGLLLPLRAAERRHSRRLPSLALRRFVAHYWSVAWDLRDKEPVLVETLPHPSVHMTFEPDGSRIGGAGTGRFSIVLRDLGWVFGVKFRPGGFHPFVGWPVSRLTDGTVAIGEVFGGEGEALGAAIVATGDEEARIALAEAFLLARLPARDETAEWIQRLVARIEADREIRKVDELLPGLDVDKRTLQRLFDRYLGVGPKWVIQRYRLHEAAEQLASGEVTDWPRLALDLGYFDQAHFIKDFKRLVGKTPAEYAKGRGRLDDA